jgi:putative SOS response-associated peptidase YedK
MCGRYRLSRRKQIVEAHFSSVSGEEDWNPRYNIAPTQPIPIIRQNPKKPVRELSLFRWGLIPSWAKESSGAAQGAFLNQLLKGSWMEKAPATSFVV